jgi:hypothetical protein
MLARVLGACAALLLLLAVRCGAGGVVCCGGERAKAVVMCSGESLVLLRVPTSEPIMRLLWGFLHGLCSGVGMAAGCVATA